MSNFKLRLKPTLLVTLAALSLSSLSACVVAPRHGGYAQVAVPDAVPAAIVGFGAGYLFGGAANYHGNPGRGHYRGHDRGHDRYFYRR